MHIKAAKTRVKFKTMARNLYHFCGFLRVNFTRNSMKRMQRQNFIYANYASKIYVDFISRVENLVKFRIAREDKILFEISCREDRQNST